MNFAATRLLNHPDTRAITLGSLAFLRSWIVLYPGRHAGFTGTPPLVGFEAVKATGLLLILCRVYVLNKKEQDEAVRREHVEMFTKAAMVSFLMDISIGLFRL